MKLSELIPIVQDEKRSEEYLYSLNILKTFRNCPRCNSVSIGIIRGKQWICHDCNYEWTKRKDSILSLTRIKYSEFLLIVKLFELELNAELTSKQLKINYKTVILLYNLFRSCLNDLLLSKIAHHSKIMKGTVGKISIRLINRKISISFNQDDEERNDSLILITRSRIQKSSAYYNFESYNPNKKLSKNLTNKKFSQLGIFWRFAKPRLMNFKGTNVNTLILYLKELEFRYNNSNVNLFEILLSKIQQNFKGGEIMPTYSKK